MQLSVAADVDVAAIKKLYPDNSYVISQRTVKLELRKNELTQLTEAVRTEYNQLLCLKSNTVVRRTFFYDDFSSVERLSKKKFIETRGDIDQDNVFHSDSRFCAFSKRIAESGSTVDLVVKTVYQDARFHCTEYFAAEVPVLNYELSLTYDTALVLAHKLYEQSSSLSEMVVEEEENKFVVSVKADSLAAFKSESKAVPYAFNYDHLLIQVPCSEEPLSDPQLDVYSFINDFTQRTPKDTAALRPLLDTILCQDVNVDTVQAIFNWVRSHIRYIAFEYAMGGYIPESPNKVAENRYGDCKGLACLTQTLLRMEAYDARLCWVSAQPTLYNSHFPTMINFDHMICAVMSDSVPLFLDATSPYHAMGEYADYLQGKEVLIQNEDAYIMHTIPIAPPSQNAVIYHFNLELNGEEVEGQMQADIMGGRKAIASAYLNESKASEDLLHKALLFWGERSLKGLDQHIEKTEDEGAIRLQQKVLLKGKVLKNRDKYYLTPNPNEIPHMENLDTALVRDVSWYIRDSLHVSAQWRLPEAYVVSNLPADTCFYGPGVKMSYHYQTGDSTLIYTRTFVRDAVILPVEQIKSYNDFVQKVKKENKKRVVLTPNTEAVLTTNSSENE